MWQSQEQEQVEKLLKSNRKVGLTEEEAKKRLEEYGQNELQEKKKKSVLFRFIEQFKDFMILILIGASMISAIVAKIEGNGDYIDSIIIIAIVVFNAIMGLVQEAKAEKSLEALKKMSAPVAKVRRNGKVTTIAGTEVVPGDIVLLEAGNYVPADCRLTESYHLKIEESSLTGETMPVTKDASAILEENTTLGDLSNMAFATTIVVNGHGEAIVTETAMHTKVGKIAKMIMAEESPETPIQRKLGEVGKILGMACLGICVFIFMIGTLKKIPALEMFMTSVGLAVAAIPEGLPAIVTIMLSIGVTRMSKKNSIIRKLPAVETLGSSRVICSDKTGTLTQNKMQVVEMKNMKEAMEKREEEFLLQLATMCTDAEEVEEEEKVVAQGEPTEVAIVNAAIQCGMRKEQLYQIMPRKNDIPFDSTRKMMSTVHKIGEKYRIITKGAPDVLLQHCTQCYENGKLELIANKMDTILSQNEKMAEKALRVIAVAYRDQEVMPTQMESEKIENNLTFVGLIGMIDPPREGVKEAVATCKKAGIKTVMITGDHIVTAKAIAKELGIMKGKDLAMTGQELDDISQKQLEKAIMKYSVFARVSPEHKVRIVKAFQSTGAVVAMTGDGVNDAPALKNADIGIAMGKNGTDVAKNASDMILTDDNFVTIVEAVKQGRNIFDNIKKAIHFLIATNIGEIVTIFMGLVLGLKTPLLAIQLLWINLVTDSLPAIALGLERPDRNIMNKKPRDAKKGIFADGLWSKIISEGIMIGMLTLVAFCIGNKFYGIEVARTMAFLALGMLELVHCFNIKSEESIFKAGIFENKYLVGAFVIGTILQVGVVFIPSVAQVFKLVSLNQIQWIWTVGISVLPIFIMEIQKKLNEYKFGKVIYENIAKENG